MTANDEPGRDPKDFIVSFVDENGNEDNSNEVQDEDKRGRFTEKEYRLEKEVWTKSISLKVSKC